MAEQTSIEWTDATFNCWEGCARVSPGCEHCYAERRAVRFETARWGPQGTRRVASPSYWRQPIRWNANTQGRPFRVFCASLADVFEDWPGRMLDGLKQPLYVAANGQWWPDPLGGSRPPLTMDDVRRRLFETVNATPALTWLLLTKRPGNILATLGRLRAMGLVASDHFPWANIWYGATVEDKRHGLPRIDVLRKVPAAVRFLSVEPLLEDLGQIDLTGIDWVIAGGESGPGARPCRLDWLRSVVAQCRAAGVPVFIKQLGSRPENDAGFSVSWRLRDKKGGDPAEWPEDLRVREFPGRAGP
jgi:protein gp37